MLTAVGVIRKMPGKFNFSLFSSDFRPVVIFALPTVEQGEIDETYFTSP